MRRDFDEEEGEDMYEEEDTGRGKKRPRFRFIDDASEDDDEEDEDDDEDYGRGGDGGRRVVKRKKRPGAAFIDDEVDVVDEEEEEEEEEFIDRNDVSEGEEDDGRRMHRGQFVPWEDDQEDVEVLEKRMKERYLRTNHTEYDAETTEVDQQALLPSDRDPKAIGREREAAVCLMQKYLDKISELQIKSVVALDHLKNFIYVEADKESHVKEACKGLRNIYAQNVKLVPIREMTDVLSVESKSVDLARDSWVRMKIGIYKGDLAKVANVDNVRQKIVVKLIPRIDLQALSNKLEGREVAKKRVLVPPPRLMNVEEARELHLRVESRRDADFGEFFEVIDSMMFKDGFLYKNVSMKSVRSVNINPTFDELEKFRTPGENGYGDIEDLSTLFGNRKKGHFMKGDTVIVIKGDLKNLKGRVEKVEEENVHIKPEMKGLPQTLTLNEEELCKYFEPGNHAEVVSGKQEGATGMVVKVEGYVLIILSDTAKEHIHVFTDDVAESSEVTSGVTRIGDYEVHDPVQLHNNNFGVIIRVESEHFQVLKGVSERPEIVLVKVRDIKYKIEKKFNGQDCFKNPVYAKDVVKIVEGSLKGIQGPVEYIYRGILFIHDRHHIEHAGFICVKSQSCVVIRGSRSNSDINMRALTHIPQSPGRFSSGGPPIPFGGSYRGGRGSYRGGRGQDSLIGKTIKVRQGPYMGYRGRVVDVKGQSVRVELESQMKVVTVDRNQIADNVAVATPYR